MIIQLKFPKAVVCERRFVFWSNVKFYPNGTGVFLHIVHSLIIHRFINNNR